ncbi:unnamed protein product [Rangifer tarandus platyrhynchus]|uniref:Uncharacterized protein n=2 Tax=Rangifer tarandus platyrhynchus TaxID=3082113 RepID=A0AC59Z0S8_RANTA|nr:unnamed protein product [Rangifer tarandus platyrhynchus]
MQAYGHPTAQAGAGPVLPRLTPRGHRAPSLGHAQIPAQEAENWDLGPELLPPLPNPPYTQCFIDPLLPGPRDTLGPLHFESCSLEGPCPSWKPQYRVRPRAS